MTTTAKIIADSINPYGKRITTFELEYPRMVHSEYMTHRVFSRNAASSRAIPVNTVIGIVESNPAFPASWGKNRAGMQATELLSDDYQVAAKNTWLRARDAAVECAKEMVSLGVHKQIVNRLLEPFLHIKVVMTTTEYANWDWLRNHKDADPTIALLAVEMQKARNESEPVQLAKNHWHVPYVEQQFVLGKQIFFDENGKQITLEQALKISASSCAQVSYRKLDTGLEKAETIFERLIESEPVHASPVEHCAKVCDCDDYTGVTSVSTRDDLEYELRLNSGNFTGGWIQYRQLIPNNVKFD